MAVSQPLERALRLPYSVTERNRRHAPRGLCKSSFKSTSLSIGIIVERMMFPAKDVHVLIPKTCEDVTCMVKGN